MLATTHSTTSQKQIYVQLLEEGTYVTRPTQAIKLEGGLYKILPTSNYNPETEIWEFPPGSIVKCENRTGPKGEYLLATQLE